MVPPAISTSEPVMTGSAPPSRPLGETMSDGCGPPPEIQAAVLERWQALWSCDPAAPPNLRPARFLEITRRLGAIPWVLQVPGPAGDGLVIGRRERGALSRRLGYLSLRTPPLGSLVIAHGGLLGPVAADPALARIDALVDAGEIDHVMFYRLPAGSAMLAALRRRPRAVVHPPARHWHLRLDRSFAATMGRHSGRHRKRLRWEARRLAEAFGEALEFRTYERIDQLDRALDEAAAVSRASYHAGVGGLVADTPVWRAQLGPAADEGRLRVHVLSGGDRPIAAMVGVNEQDTLHVLAMAYLPAYAALSPGKHLLLHAIRRACEDGMARVDYGTGDADYKRIYGSGFVEEATVHLYGRGAAARTGWLIDRAVLGTDGLLRRAAGGRGADRVKAAWRRALAARSG